MLEGHFAEGLKVEPLEPDAVGDTGLYGCMVTFDGARYRVTIEEADEE